jgi:hypothetical protein
MDVRRWLRPAALGVGASLAVLVMALLVLAAAQRGRTLPNTLVSGVHVGRMTVDEVRDVLVPVVVDRESTVIDFASAGERFALDPATVRYRIDLEATIGLAMDRGRRGSPLARLGHLTSLRATRDVGFVDAWGPDELDRWVADVVARADREASDGALVTDPVTLAVTAVPPYGQRRVRSNELRSLAAQELGQRSLGVLELPADITPVPVDPADVERAAMLLQAALRAPLELTSQGADLTIDPRVLATLVDVRSEPGTPRRAVLHVDPAALDRSIGELARQAFDVDPIDSRYEVPRRPPATLDAKGSTTFAPVPIRVGLDAGRDGTRFDPVLAAAQLTRMIEAGTRAAIIDLVVTPARISPREAEEGRPTHLLGTFTTYFTPGQVRNVNIQRLADEIDGTIVLPGAQFSINEISGPRTCDKGYVLAGTIVAGELVDTCGGGTSQFGTTTFNAAFFAGMQLDQWKAHSWYLSRYPMGREATLTYPILDVRFTNVTDGNLLVRTAHDDRSVTVSIYGRPIHTSVSATLGPQSAPRGFATITREDPELPAGAQRVVQEGAGGFTVEVVRVITLLDGTTQRQVLRTVYTPQQRIIAVGVGGIPIEDPAPAPPPPAPDPDPDAASD